MLGRLNRLQALGLFPRVSPPAGATGKALGDVCMAVLPKEREDWPTASDSDSREDPTVMGPLSARREHEPPPAALGRRQGWRLIQTSRAPEEGAVSYRTAGAASRARRSVLSRRRCHRPTIRVPFDARSAGVLRERVECIKLGVRSCGCKKSSGPNIIQSFILSCTLQSRCL